MQQVKVHTGFEHDVQELDTALINLGIHALAYNPIRRDVWGVYVPDEQPEEAQHLISALHHVETAAERQRGGAA